MRVGRIVVYSIFAVVGLSSVCSGAGKKTMRIAVATFSHEICTFAPKPTTIEDWEYFGPPTADIIDTVSGYIGGFRRMCDEFGSVELVGITSPRRVRGGSSGSWNTTEAFDKYTNLMAEDLKKAGYLNGLFLALHGANGQGPSNQILCGFLSNKVLLFSTPLSPRYETTFAKIN